MTPEQFKLCMLELQAVAIGDAEAAHAEADELMCIILKEFGYAEGVEIFQNMKKWYA